jgi:hypothetical protein
MSEPITVAAFTKIAEAEQAVVKLINGGVPANTLSILAKDMQCEKQACAAPAIILGAENRRGFVDSSRNPHRRARLTTCALFRKLAQISLSWPGRSIPQRSAMLLK